jgi:hypothetical protein
MNESIREGEYQMITIGRNTGKQSFYNIGVYICDYESDIADLPVNKSAGSTAKVVETGNTYMLNNFHQWILQPDSGGTSSGGNIIYDGGNVSSSSGTDTIYDGGTV